MDKLRYGCCRVSCAADDSAPNLDTQQQALEAFGIQPELICRDAASGGSLDRNGRNVLIAVVRPADTITVSHVKGGEKTCHWGVVGQGKCPGKCSAKMSLRYAAMVSDVDGLGAIRCFHPGGPPASR